MLKLAFIFLWPGLGQAAPTVDQVIDLSTRQIIQKDRPAALKILTKALRRQNLSKEQRARLSQAFNVASQIFFTDRGQSLFEAGRNLYLVSSPEAVKKMAEALSYESNNALILWGLVKAHLRERQCELAQLEFEKLPKEIKKEKPSFRPLLAYCKAMALPFWSGERLDPFYVHFFRGVFFFKRGAVKEALAELEKARKLNPEFPETFFWLWKADPQEKELALKYKRDCETQKLQLSKKFEEFPQLCHFQSEVSELELNDEI